ncbi:MAG: tetratricopeptide repeat protein [Bacteroidia bacterium]|nr:tetratricopeptide repeat protein [Bacteroidia bacterium]
MNRLFMILCFVAVAATVNAQKAKVTSAYMYMNSDQLDKAKVAIDEAVMHEKSMNMAKAWFYRGEIYIKIKNSPEFSSIAPKATAEAYKSFQKVKELDEKGYYKPDIAKYMPFLINGTFEDGVKQFNAKDYTNALASFETVLLMSPTDSLAMLNAAFAAERSGDNESAKKHYSKLIEMKFDDVRVYSYLATIQQKEGDEEAAMKTIKEGRIKYPEDQNLIIQELNFFLGKDNQEEALASIDIAISKDPTNAQLHFAKGTLLDKAGKLEGAVVSYKDAIKNDDKYFDAYYNLGGLYFNQGAELYNAANDIPPNKLKEYQAAKAKFEAKFKEAMPYLEKAHELKPDDFDTMNSLKQLYARTGDNDKYATIKDKLEAAKQ